MRLIWLNGNWESQLLSRNRNKKLCFNSSSTRMLQYIVKQPGQDAIRSIHMEPSNIGPLEGGGIRGLKGYSGFLGNMFYKKQSLSQSAAVVNSFPVTAQLHSGSLSSFAPNCISVVFTADKNGRRFRDQLQRVSSRNLWVTSNPSSFSLSDHKKPSQSTPPASVVPNYYLVIFHVLSPTPEFSHCWNLCQFLCTCEQNIFGTIRGHAALFGLVSGFWCQTKAQIIRETHICPQSPTTITACHKKMAKLFGPVISDSVM